MGKSLEILFCYAHEDEALRRELERQLIPLRHQGLINIWYDQEISPGAEWEGEIDKHLKTAHIILLLISSAFLNSEYCYGIEMKRALERHQLGESRVIPIILRPTLWQGTPLGKLQALPTGAIPVTDPSWHDLDSAYLDVAQGIQKVVEELSVGSRVDSEGNGKKQHIKIGEFARLRKSDLRSIPFVIQALDHQWLSRSQLQGVIQKGYLTPEIERQRVEFARADYIRGLINGEQLVIPLPYIYNNSVIYQDYLHKGRKQEAFKTLLELGVIIPYLSTEKSPIDQIDPADTDAHGFEAWQQLCHESYMHCLRFSWNDKENDSLTRHHLDKRLHTFVVDAVAGDIDTYIQDLGLGQEEKDDLRRFLVKMGQFGLELLTQDKRITRSDLYRAFITKGDNPADREFDGSNSLAVIIKQLVDLSYNGSLADALNGWLITPIDSPPRTTLQEWQRFIQRPSITGKEILELLQRVTLHLVGRRLNIESTGTLSLQDVYEIRRMEEWASYMQSMGKLLRDPLSFAENGITDVYESYNKLAQRITGLVAGQEGKEQSLTSWLPTVELVFHIAGALLSCTWTREGPIYQLSGQLAEVIKGDTVPVIARLIIHDRVEKRVRQDLSMAIDFMHFQIPDVQEQWKEIEMAVRKLPGF